MPSSIFSFDLPLAFARLPARRHAWHALLFAGFVAVYAGSLFLLNSVSGDGRPPVTIRTLAAAALSDKTEVVFLGNSVVEAAINSSLYPVPVMALPMANGNYEIDEIVLRSQMDRLPGLKIVVMQFDITCLALDRLGITIDYSAFAELGVPVEHIPRAAWWRARQKLVDHPWVRPLLFGERMTPRALIWDRRHAAGRLPPEPGYSRQTGTLLEKDRIWYFTEAPVAVLPVDPEVVRLNEEAAVRISALLRDRGVRLVFLRYPTRGGYNFFCSTEWERVLDNFRVRISGMTGDVRIIDLAEDVAFVTSDFRDTIHLNERGAAKLALRLPGLLNPP